MAMPECKHHVPLDSICQSCCKAAPEVPAGMVLIRHELIERMPALDTGNYSHEQVYRLNSWAKDVVEAAHG